jgi:hypothetical protein
VGQRKESRTAEAMRGREQREQMKKDTDEEMSN